MIVVTVELRSARTGRKSLLGIAVIGNDETGSPTTGNYNAALSVGSRLEWETRVEGFPRQRRNAWDLLYLALRNVVGERNALNQKGDVT